MNAVLTGMDGQALASAVMAWLGQALLFGTLLAALTWLVIRLLGRRMPPAVEALLWTIVLLKFLVPIGPSWSFSMGNVYNSLPVPAEVQAVSIDTVVDPIPPIASDIIMNEEGISWSTVVGLCYAALAVVLVSRRAWCHRRFLSLCRTLPHAEGSVLNITINICRSLGMHRAPSVRISEETPVSFVTGLFRPLIVLSKNQLARPSELKSVILHEVAHLRRGDLVVRYLQWIAGSLLFFWPVVMWVNRRIDSARELACDEWALSRGDLEAGDYARCVLHAVQPYRMSFHSTPLAANRKKVERRIEMILGFTRRSSKRHQLGLLTIAALLLWSGFALTGAIESVARTDWPATKEAVREHAVQVYNLVADFKAADMNGDGELTYAEKDAYLVALAMLQPKAFMEEFPYADRNSSGKLDYLEVNGVIYGITLIAYADRRPNAEAGGDNLDLEFCHEALHAQRWLIDHKKKEPSVSSLDNIWSVMKRIQGSRKNYSCRMLDHGGPDDTWTHPKGDAKRFKELEGNIKTLKARLKLENDPAKAAKLEAMLVKLEAILTRLENS